MSKHILVVDNSVSTRQLIGALLREAHYKVTLAEDGKDAMDKCKSTTFDLIYTDQILPRMDAVSLINSLRGMKRCKRTPIVMLTSGLCDDIKQRGKAAGATGWIVKSCLPDVLFNVTHRALRHVVDT